MAAACAVRPEELFAFRWRHVVTLPATNRIALLVEDTVHRGILRPRKAKTKGSMDYVALPHRLAAELGEWREQTTHADNDDFIFANSRGGFISKDNFLNRVLYPVRDGLKISEAKLPNFAAHLCDEGIRRTSRHFEGRAEASASREAQYGVGELHQGNTRQRICNGRCRVRRDGRNSGFRTDSVNSARYCTSPESARSVCD